MPRPAVSSPASAATPTAASVPAAARRSAPSTNGSPTTARAQAKARRFSVAMPAAHASAAPVTPCPGISHRPSATVTSRPASVAARCSPLRPPISSRLCTLPTPVLTSMASASTVIAVAPAANSGPKSCRNAGPNTASSR